MKKKLVLTLALILIMALGCITFIGCDKPDNNSTNETYSNPVEFMEAWKNSDNKGYHILTQGGVWGYSNGVAVKVIDLVGEYPYQIVYMEVKDGQQIQYIGRGESKDSKLEWEIRGVSLEYEEEYFETEINDTRTYFDLQIGDDYFRYKITEEIFNEKFYKNEDNWFCGKDGDEDYEELGFKIEGNKMFMSKYDYPDCYYFIGYEEIVIPQEAKDAYNEYIKKQQN